MVDARAAAAAAAAWAALLLGWAAAGQAAAPPDISCFDCAWLEELPLDEWSAERNSTRCLGRGCQTPRSMAAARGGGGGGEPTLRLPVCLHRGVDSPPVPAAQQLCTSPFSTPP